MINNLFLKPTLDGVKVDEYLNLVGCCVLKEMMELLKLASLTNIPAVSVYPF